MKQAHCIYQNDDHRWLAIARSRSRKMTVFSSKARRIRFSRWTSSANSGWSRMLARPSMNTSPGPLSASARAPMVSARCITRSYRAFSFARCGSYGEVARRTGLDWRTVKKYTEA